MNIVYSPRYEMNIGEHVFPTRKFRLIKELLVKEGVITEDDIEEPAPPTDEQLLSVLTPQYLKDLRGYRHTERTIRSELPITREIVEGCILSTGGSILAARRALETGGACHIGGGFHHGFADMAEGFCYINDVAVAAAVMLKEGRVQRIAVVDTDVHQGNGTAHIFKDDPRVFTFSIHQERLYPVKERSDLDIGLDNGTGDDEYCRLLADAMDRIVRDVRPQLVINVAGADPFQDDQLGNLELTHEGMARRDWTVLEPLAKAQIPFVTVTGGGYARNVADTVALHARTVRVAKEVLGRSGSGGV